MTRDTVPSATQDQGVTLCAGTAERGQRVAGTHSDLPVASLAQAGQFEGGVKRDPCPGHSDRVTDRDGAAAGVDAFAVDSELRGRRERDRGECFVDLDDVELLDGDALLGDRLLDGV